KFALMADCHCIYIGWPAAVFIENSSMVGVRAGWYMVGHHMQVFQSLCRTLTNLLQPFQPLSVLIDRTACQVIDRLAIPSQLKTEITIAELIEHAAFLRGLGSDPAYQLYSRFLRIKTEQVT